MTGEENPPQSPFYKGGSILNPHLSVSAQHRSLTRQTVAYKGEVGVGEGSLLAAEGGRRCLTATVWVKTQQEE